MRRKVTVNLDERFIVAMDDARGDVPRSRWLERPWSPLTAAGMEGKDLGAIPTAEAELDARAKIARSPEVPEKSEAPRELPEHLLTGHPSVRPTHPAYHAQLAQIEQYRRDARA